MTADQWVALILGLAGGGTLSEIVKLITGRPARQRAELDRLAALAAAERDRADAAEAAEEDRARRERIALELLSATRRSAIDHGVPITALPAVNLEGG